MGLRCVCLTWARRIWHPARTPSAASDERCRARWLSSEAFVVRTSTERRGRYVTRIPERRRGRRDAPPALRPPGPGRPGVRWGGGARVARGRPRQRDAAGGACHRVLLGRAAPAALRRADPRRGRASAGRAAGAGGAKVPAVTIGAARDLGGRCRQQENRRRKAKFGVIAEFRGRTGGRSG